MKQEMPLKIHLEDFSSFTLDLVEKIIHEIFVISNFKIMTITIKKSTNQDWEIVIYTLSVRIPQTNNANT